MKTIVIPTDSLVEARNLVARLQSSAGFRDYLLDRLHLVIPAALVYVILATAGVAAAITLLAQGWFVLPAFLIAPFLLAGTYAVTAYLFLSWMEWRALRHALGHGPAALPRVPWAYVGVFLGIPLLALVVVWWKVALPLIVLALAAPLAFTRLDRG